MKKQKKCCGKCAAKKATAKVAAKPAAKKETTRVRSDCVKIRMTPGVKARMIRLVAAINKHAGREDSLADIWEGLLLPAFEDMVKEYEYSKPKTPKK